MDSSRRREILVKAQLIFYGIPVGNNYSQGYPIVGNKSLAKVVADRIDSCTKNREEFKYMLDAVMQLLKETKGQTVSRVKFDTPHKGVTDEKGFLLKDAKGVKIIGR